MGALPRRHAFGEADHRNVEHDIKRMVRRGPDKLHYDRLERAAVLYDLGLESRRTR